MGDLRREGMHDVLQLSLATIVLGVVVACGGTGPAEVTLSRPNATQPSNPMSWPVRFEIDALPSNIRTLDIDFGHKIHLVGYRFDPETATPNERVKLTFYWRCDESVKEGWRLFTLLEYDDVDGWRSWRNVGDGLGVDRWRPGKYYVDSQTFAAPAVVTEAVTVMVGIAKGTARLHVLSGPSDGENRGIVGKIVMTRE